MIFWVWNLNCYKYLFVCGLFKFKTHSLLVSLVHNVLNPNFCKQATSINSWYSSELLQIQSVCHVRSLRCRMQGSNHLCSWCLNHFKNPYFWWSMCCKHWHSCSKHLQVCTLPTLMKWRDLWNHWPTFVINVSSMLGFYFKRSNLWFNKQIVALLVWTL
jgi:hypothetical protein